MKTTEPSPPPPTAPADTVAKGPQASIAEPLAIGPHHRTNFEQAEAYLRKTYGKSPPADDLMRLWLAGASPWEITRVFEESVLNISGSGLIPDDNGHYSQTLLDL